MNHIFRRGSVGIVLACGLLLAALSINWPLVGDASLMHYVILLFDHGMVPYKTIVDVNLPGTYLVEWLVIHLFGHGAPAWRLYDLSLCGMLTWAMVSITTNRNKRTGEPADQDVLPGLFAGGLFFLLHGRDGIAELGQRDLLMTVFLVWALALLLKGMRLPKPWLLASAAALSGCAACVKPTALLFWFAMLTVLVLQRTRAQALDRQPRTLKNIACALLPVLLAPALFALALYRVHALRALFRTVFQLDAYHNTLFRLPASYFLYHLLPSTLLPLFLLSLLLLLPGKDRLPGGTAPVENLLATGAVCGLLSFWIQGKGFSYHRYPLDAFLLLFLALRLFDATRRTPSHPTLRYAVGALGIAYGTLWLAPQCVLHAEKLSESPRSFERLLEADLTSLGGPAKLDGRIQCLDYTAGCVTALEHLGIAQSTGFLYDCYALDPAHNRIALAYRDAFWRALSARLPDVLVLSNQNCAGPNSFHKFDDWPQLTQLLRDHYTLVKEQTPPDPIHWASQPAQPYSYRLLVRTH